MSSDKDVLCPLIAQESAEPRQDAEVAWEKRVSVNTAFLRDLFGILSSVRPWGGLALVALSLADTLAGAQVGKVNGYFYRVLVDKDQGKFGALILGASAAFIAATVLRSTRTFLTGYFSLIWRVRLTRKLQDQYCQGERFYSLEGLLDNPDQRIVQDAARFSDSLAAVVAVLLAAPFKVAFYSWWMLSIVSVGPVLLVYAFFLTALPLQRLLLAPIARRLYVKERAEGDLRFAQMRIRVFKEEVAMWRGTGAERAELEREVEGLRRASLCLLMWQWALAGCSTALEYSGALLNYLCVAIPIFGGAGAAWDSGRRAEFISNASFATLSLIYSFTEVVDLSERIAELAGLTARLSHLSTAFAEKGTAESPEHDQCVPQAVHVDRANSPHRDGTGPDEGRGGGAEQPDFEGQASQQGALILGPLLVGGGSAEEGPGQGLLQGQAVAGPTGGANLEVTVHGLGRQLRARVAAVFPDAPAGPQPLVALLTWQRARCDLAPCPGSPFCPEVAQEMDRLLDSFLVWFNNFALHIGAAGAWVDAVDPCSGTALRGTRGERWSEVHGAHTLLGYRTLDGSTCPLIVHPRFGIAAYPVTVFTNAPMEVVCHALSCSLDGSPQHESQKLQQEDEVSFFPPAGPPPPCTVLDLRGVGVRTPGGTWSLRDLNLCIRAGECCLLEGPSGCGKTTFLHALRGLHPIAEGSVLLPPPNQVVFVPQQALAAPGCSLAQQVTYPDSGPQPWPHLYRLLCAVQLDHLLQRVGQDWEASRPWAEMLSGGEGQRLAVARVLHQHPALAVLDEGLSALSVLQAYRLLSLLQRAGIAVLLSAQPDSPLRSVAHRVISLAGDGSGRWSPLLPQHAPT
eukprot:jgi/Botrbrau1/20372/Bobra.0006s0035.1